MSFQGCIVATGMVEKRELVRHSSLYLTPLPLSLSLYFLKLSPLPPPLSPGNYYGTPKPPAEPTLVQPDLVDQVLFDEDYDNEVQRKRTTSVSKMDRKDSVVPEEEDDDERPPLANGLPGQYISYSKPLSCPFSLSSG